MGFVRAKLRRLAVVASMAMGLLVLAPTLSHALAAALGGVAVLGEVCTAAGQESPLVDRAAGDNGAPMPSGASAAHCPWCTPTAAVLGPPPALPSFAAWAARQVHESSCGPARRTATPARPRAWPRAPPTLG
jgi:hypothetical protein